MPDPEDPQWAADFAATVHLYETDNLWEALCAAKQSLTNKDLSRYWQMKNCLVIAFSEDNWSEAEEFRLIAESVYQRADINTFGKKRALERLSEVRGDLDALKAHQEKYFPNGVEEDEENEEDQERDRSGHPDVIKVIFRSLYGSNEDGDDDMTDPESEGEKEARLAYDRELRAELRRRKKPARRSDQDPKIVTGQTIEASVALIESANVEAKIEAADVAQAARTSTVSVAR